MFDHRKRESLFKKKEFITEQISKHWPLLQTTKRSKIQVAAFAPGFH